MLAHQGDPEPTLNPPWTLNPRLQVRLGDTVTFLPTPLRNWWGRPRLQQAWLGLSIYVIVVMVRCIPSAHAARSRWLPHHWLDVAEWTSVSLPFAPMMVILTACWPVIVNSRSFHYGTVRHQVSSLKRCSCPHLAVREAGRLLLPVHQPDHLPHRRRRRGSGHRRQRPLPAQAPRHRQLRRRSREQPQVHFDPVAVVDTLGRTSSGRLAQSPIRNPSEVAGMGTNLLGGQRLWTMLVRAAPVNDAVTRAYPRNMQSNSISLRCHRRWSSPS